jgi:hypothetical protein
MRTLTLTERSDALELVVTQGEARAAFQFPLDAGPIVQTTRGPMLIETLAREVVVADRRQDLSVAVEWYAADGELVRRDVHVVVKQPGVVADAVAASIG